MTETTYATQDLTDIEVLADCMEEVREEELPPPIPSAVILNSVPVTVMVNADINDLPF